MTEKGKERFDRKFGEKYRIITEGSENIYDQKKRDFHSFYSDELERMETAKLAVENLINLLFSRSEILLAKVTSRIKKRHECIAKFERKYRNIAEKSKKEKYHIKDYITDLIGIRVVTIYEDDVLKCAEELKKHFTEIHTTDKYQETKLENSKFGYLGIHLDIKMNEERKHLPEYSQFNDLQFEIQIRSSVQDAWSEIDHKIKYKKSIPIEIQRRINRMAAVFELADQEFTQIRNQTSLWLELNSDQLNDHKLLNSLSFISVARDLFPDYNFENPTGSESANKIDGFVSEVVSYDDATVLMFKDAMKKFLPDVIKYSVFKKEYNVRMNPFNIIRHALYSSDPKKYEDILWQTQRDSFNFWLEHQSSS